MKQLTAKHPQMNMTIIQRFLLGDRYIKVLPSNMLPLILENLRKQFNNRPVHIKEVDGWVKIERYGEDEQLKTVAEKSYGKQKVDEDYIFEQEAKMLSQQGFIVKVEDIK